MKKFLIITETGSNIIYCEDFYKAVDESYNNHTEFDHIIAIIRIPDEYL